MTHRSLTRSLRRCLREESGQDAIEYALITGVFSLAVITIFPPILTIFERRFVGIAQIFASISR